MIKAAYELWRKWEFRASARNRKGIKLGGCLRKQGVEDFNQHTKSCLLAQVKGRRKKAAPPQPWCVGRHSTCHLRRRAANP